MNKIIENTIDNVQKVQDEREMALKAIALKEQRGFSFQNDQTHRMDKSTKLPRDKAEESPNPTPKGKALD